MRNSKKVLGILLLLSSGFLLFAWYLQHYQNYGPCTLCVLQRYAYVLIALFCLLGRITPYVRFASFLAFLSALGGSIAAAWQLWMTTETIGQCARSTLEGFVNGLVTARWFPSLFEADGSCDQAVDRIFGISVPMWSFGWLVFFAVVFAILMLRPKQPRFTFR